MKKTLIVFALMALFAGCATTPGSTTDPYKDALVSVTAARQATTQLMVNNKISIAQDQSAELKFDAARAGIVAAQALSSSNPTQAAAQLAAQKQATQDAIPVVK